MKDKHKKNEVKFYLKNKTNGKGSIFAIFHFGYREDGNNKPFQLSTGERIEVRFWDQENQCVIKNPQVEWQEINSNLRKMHVNIKDAYDNLILEKREVTPESIKSAMGLGGNSAPIKLPEKITLIGFMVNYQKTSEKNWKTKRHYNTTVNHLKKYSKIRRRKINFDDIDQAFYNDFVKYLESCSLRINTIGGHIKNLKVFLRAALELKIHNNYYFENRNFKIIQEDVDSIYLDKDEIKRIYEINLSKYPILEQTRDAFIISALTGLRYSDIENLKTANIGEDGIIRITQVKTKKQVCLPIGNVVNTILLKYSPNLPKIISNQKFNDNLKIIAKLAKFNGWETITRSNGGQRITKKILKYWLVSSHTARRSFATNLALSGTPIAQIMAITGHRTEKSFWKYVKIRPTQNASMLINHPYLNF